MPNIYLNGKKEELDQNITIAKLLEIKKVKPEVVTVELNEKIVDKKEYSRVSLNSGDKLEFVYYMGGGSPFSDRIAEDTLELITKTPMVRLNKIVGPDMARILAKLEF